MQTQCPYCQTVFRLTEAHLNLAQGKVRCGQCRNIFDATKNLVKKPVTPPSLLPPKPSLNSTLSQVEATPDLDDFPDIFQEDVEALRKRTSWQSLLFWLLLAALLAASLLAQIIWLWQRDLILQHPQLRPWLDSFCYTFLCTLPVTRDVESFQIQQGPLIRPLPELPEVIEVQVVFSNEAVFPQPYPEVQLTFQDSNNRPIAQRRFKPAEYLPSVDLTKMMRPEASVHLKLELKSMEEIVEEGNLVVGYTFEFL